MNNFDKNYKDLTKQQREAANYTEGPLLVIAGPGTGKTQLLSMRVAQILRKTDADSSNILCLTFTNKASANMRNRLQELIGPESMQVNVKTFHGLAAEIMSEYPEYFWNGAKLTTAPDAVQTELIESIISHLPLDNPLAIKFAGQYTQIKWVSDSLKLIKEAGLSPEKLQAILEANLAFIDIIEPRLIDTLSAKISYKTLDTLKQKISGLPDQPIDDSIAPLISLKTYIVDSLNEAIVNDTGTNKATNTSKWKSKILQSENGIKGMHRQRKANEKWLKLVDVYSRYRDELHKRGYYDYSDMLIEVISQLQNESSMLSDIQERYQYLLIDEFQDSNAAQMRLAHLIASHPLNEGKPNLMVVGDDDQSIYKFNGAELNNMLSFKRMYPTTKIIVLEDNFRSSQKVLDTAKQIIELANDRIVKRQPDLSKNLVAKNEPNALGKIEHFLYSTKEQQIYDIVNRIRDEFRGDPSQTQAVLARSHESLEIIASELNRQHIPINYERQNNILDNPAIRQIIALSRAVQGIIDGGVTDVNYGISEFISHKMWEIEPVVLWELAIDNRYNPNWLNSLIDHENKRLKTIGDWLMNLSQIAQFERVEIVLDYMLGLRDSKDFVSPIRAYYIDKRDVTNQYIETLAAIRKLRSMTNEFSMSNTAYLKDLLQLVDLHRVNNLTIANDSSFVSADNAVQLMTVHKAKGLEFDSVYIIDCTEKQWQPRVNRSSTPANLPLRPYGDDMDDYIRLMYVAMTRAKRNIATSSYKINESNEPVVTTPIISSLLANNVELPDEQTTVRILETNTRWPALENHDAKQVLKPILDNFTLNVTTMLNFLDLTRGGVEYFYETNLLRLPGPRTSSLALGTAIHGALEMAQRLVNKGQFNVDDVKRCFDLELDREPMPKDELDRWKPYGHNLLNKLFGKQMIDLPEGGIPEQKLSDIHIGGAILGGKLDHIIVDDSDKAILISDYKTGGALSSFDSKNKQYQVKIWRHKTQLIFYALLAKNFNRYSKMDITCRMLYLEAEKPRDVSREYTPSSDELSRLAKLANAVYKKITDLNLPDTSEYTQDIEGIIKFENDLISGKV